MPDRKSPLFVAKSLIKEKFSDAQYAFFAGSVVRGEASSHSDIDLILVYNSVETAFRESFYYKKWPVETYVHDPQTLSYFLKEVDRKQGLPELHQMLMEAVILPEPNPQAQEFQELARSLFEEGPPPLTDEEKNLALYRISEVLDDMREKIPRHELFASMARFYPLFCDYFFRSQGFWSARGKAVPRRLKRVNPTFFRKFDRAVKDLFANGETKDLIELCEEFIGYEGGYFEGFKQVAPQSWRDESQ